jgi:hypothetical protein
LTELTELQEVPMVRGSCLCGAVRYEIAEPFEEMHHCHCSRCRKAHGAAFATFARTKRASLRFLAGEEKLRHFRSSPAVQRSFCGSCGSNLLGQFDALPQAVWVAVGSLDDDPGMHPQAHIFVGSKASWHTITDELPQFLEYPPEDDAPDS